MFPIKSPEHHVNCIYGVVRPLYCLARLIGLFPFSIKMQPNGKHNQVYFTIIDFIVFVIHLVVYASFAYINIQQNFIENAAASPLLTLGTRTLLVIGLTNSILCISTDLYNRYKIFNIFVQCQTFDIKMKALGSRPNYKREKTIVLLYIAAWMIACVIFYSISLWIFMKLYQMDAIIVIFPSYFLLNFVFSALLSIYTFFLFSVNSRYCLLNENFSRFSLDTTANTKVVATSKKDMIRNLMNLADLHDLLNDILETVNRCYSIQAMLAFAMSFSFSVFSLFSCYRGWIMRSVDEYKQFSMAIVFTMWSCFYHAFSVVLMWVGHSTRNEGKLTGTLMHRAINKCSDTEIVKRLLAFSQQINHRIPEANCNLFSFDWTLLYSVVAATVTYLIILIQFDASGFNPVSKAHNLSSSG